MTDNTIPEPLEPTLGEIRIFSGTFAPRSWKFCQGEYLPISQFSTLFSILGTIYGGDGRTTFGLPDFIGRTPVGVGEGIGLSNKKYGQYGGMEHNTLSQSNIPSHYHEIYMDPKCYTPVGVDAGSKTNIPEDNRFGKSTTKMYYTDYNTALGENNFDIKFNAKPKLKIGYAGGIPDLKVKGGTTDGENDKTESFPIMQEYIALNYIICVISDNYPSRN